ncbi:ATP-binding protein [Methanococcus voltae]|uniref:DNA helicase n=1 Tax=Methanococcus voltae (strain ATCC BAA-1334 / A3) TaxID=456320 RepID=D7DTP1_METV3|nr:minichromosome maintenance protein MCM [Methanococcus voltae]MCS3901355.1 replicative DNA helicase Mcm [Methanococcus voltae]
MYNLELDFDEEYFVNTYGSKIKKFIKDELAINTVRDNVFEFDIKKFLHENIEACDITDHIYENPKLSEDTIFQIFKEAYLELFPIDNSKKVEKELEKIQIAFKNPIGCDRKIDEITSSEINNLVKFEGNIIKAAKVCALLKRACFVCASCGNIQYKTVRDYFTPLKMYCRNQNCGTEMRLDQENSTYANIQELEIQQPIDLMKNPDDPPRSIRTFLENSNGIYSGRVDVVGTVMKKQSRPNMPVYEIYTRSNHVNLSENFQKIEVKDLLRDGEKVDLLKELGKNKNIIDILSKFLIPQIKGHDLVKKAILLQQVKGCIKYLPDGSELRNDSHILLITDPGIGKSTMLRRIARLFPQNGYASVTTATGGGLTANVVREATEIGDGWVVKPGVFVKANQGTACIDELTVDKNVMKFILEAMESQTIHINKGGINVKLPAKCAVLAACNPKYGRFDRNLGVVEQLNMPQPLLSRFDLIFPLKDNPDRKRDAEIADHILSTHYESATKQYDVLADLNIGGITVDDELLKNYIIFARTCAYMEDNKNLYLRETDSKLIKTPNLNKNSMKMIKDFYVDMRKHGEGNNPIPITARQLEAVVRISEMHAKARLSDKVNEKDTKVAIDIIDECLRQVAFDPETGTFDIDKGMGKIPKSKMDKMNVVMEIIRELSALSETKLANKDDIINRAEECHIKEVEVEDLLEKLAKNAEVFSPKFGKYRLT